MKQVTKYVRRGKVIRSTEGGEPQTFKSVNAAKRESRKLQLASGGLGCGVLRVEGE